MAILALLAELAFVLVIFLVAAMAIHRHVFVFMFGMTVRAGDTLVLAIQREFRLTMIEDEILPFCFVMTSRALITQATLMLVDRRMATDAFQRRTFIALLWMAIATTDFFVFATQRELGTRVIKFELRPTYFIMAIFALLAQLALVRVFTTVAVIT